MASCQKFARYCRYSLNIFNQVVLKSGFLCAVRLFGRPNKKHAYIFVDKHLNALASSKFECYQLAKSC